MGSGLIVGREEAKLDPSSPQGGKNFLYAAELLDKAKVCGLVYEHCTFANVSFKDARLAQCRFLNCAFIDCYFRHTEIQNCSFVGCKFINCKFIKPRFLDNTFEFPEFRGCFVPWESFGHALPLDPGFRYAIADELSREAGAAGVMTDARRYRLIGEEAYERHLWRTAWASGGSYYEKARPPLERTRAGAKWIARKFNRLLWGYGERGTILARSFLVTAGLFAVAFWALVSDDLAQDGKALSAGDYALYSFDNLLAGTGFSQVTASGALARWMAGLEVFAGLVFIGLFVSLVFNWIRRR